MTEEERQRKLEQLDKLKKLKQLKDLRAQRDAQQAIADPGEPEKATLGSAVRDIQGVGQAMLSGTLSEFGDEVTGAVRSFADALLPETEADRIAREATGAEKESFLDGLRKRYEMYVSDARNAREELREEAPGVEFAAGMLGGLANPLNKVAPGLGGSGGIWTRVGASTARGGLEGALAGYGAGEGESRGQTAIIGAGTGGLASGLLTGVGGRLGRALSKKRIQQELGKGEGQIPIHMADPEGGLGKFYRDFVGGTWGGRGMLGKQESSYINRNPKLAQLGLSEIPERVGTRYQVGQLKDEIADHARVAGSNIDSQKLALKKSIAKSVKESKQASKRAVAAAEESGARSVLADAMPSTMPPETKNKILNMRSLNDAEEALSSWWSENGFKVVKDKAFKFDDDLAKRLSKMVNADPDLKIELGNIVGKAAGLQKRLGWKPTTKFEPGQEYFINGDALMAMRNFFAMPSNRSGRTFSGKALRDVAEQFDNMIFSQLDDASADAYRDELRRWSTKQAVSKAASQSRKAAQDSFTPKQVASKFSDAKRAKPGRKLAKAAVRQVEEYKEAGKESVERLKEQASDRAEWLANRKRRISQQKRAATNRLERATEGLMPENRTAWSMGATTAMMGVPLAAATGGLGLGAIPAGVATGTMLASRPAQRLLAGQTGGQRALNKALAEGRLAPATRYLSREAARRAAEREKERSE